MFSRASNKAVSLLVTAGAVIVGSSYAALVFSSGFASLFQNKHASGSGMQWPVVVGENLETLGVYGGISTAYNHLGGRESAILLILPTGYIVPVLGNGEIATFPVAYFANKNCEEREYLPVTAPLPGLLPMRGMIYRSLSSNALVYVSKHKERSLLSANSRMLLNQDGTRVCEQVSSDLQVLEVMRNSKETTGLDSGRIFPRAFVEVVNATPRSQAIAHPSAERLPGGTSETAYPDDMDDDQEACSPGCLLNALGNGSCDIECYVEACYYDQGDCDEVAPKKLEQMLSDMCSPGCFSADVGDGYCDSVCNNQACRFDGGDCK